MSSIEQTAAYVRQALNGAEAGHDWWHIQRVWSTAKTIGLAEGAQMEIVELAALLHDIADSKFHGGDEEIGPKKAEAYMRSIGVLEQTIEQVVLIIRNISFKGGKTERTFFSKELDVVQDADRLDAIGAIGIARTFNFGGYKNNEMYNPDRPPQFNMTKEEYKLSNGTTINHFYEKLLLLKDRMNTSAGRQMAEDRHRFMEVFLEQFYAEWRGEK
ncbi:MAG: HD domain-containing protein [Flavobacteriales bacterium]